MELINLVLQVLSAIFLVGGLFFLLVGTVGLLRFPDIYTRLHATTKCDTLGAGLILLSLVLQSGAAVTAKLLLIILFILVTNPTAAHVIAKAAHVTGHRPVDSKGCSDDRSA